jgi:hypothetical protein
LLSLTCPISRLLIIMVFFLTLSFGSSFRFESAASFSLRLMRSVSFG